MPPAAMDTAGHAAARFVPDDEPKDEPASTPRRFAPDDEEPRTPATSSKRLAFEPEAAIPDGRAYEWWVFSREKFRPVIEIKPGQPASLEDVLEFVGGFGPWQRRVTTTTLIFPWIACGAQSISAMFTSPLLPAEWEMSADADQRRKQMALITVLYFIGW